MGYEKIISQKGGNMARDPEINRRLVCNWDEKDNMFYCIKQVWHKKEERYVNSSFLEVEKIEVNKEQNQFISYLVREVSTLPTKSKETIGAFYPSI